MLTDGEKMAAKYRECFWDSCSSSELKQMFIGGFGGLSPPRKKLSSDEIDLKLTIKQTQTDRFLEVIHLCEKGIDSIDVGLLVSGPDDPHSNLEA